jgi:hypothetical protein
MARYPEGERCPADAFAAIGTTLSEGSKSEAGTARAGIVTLPHRVLDRRPASCVDSDPMRLRRKGLLSSNRSLVGDLAESYSHAVLFHSLRTYRRRRQTHRTL